MEHTEGLKRSFEGIAVAVSLHQIVLNAVTCMRNGSTHA